MKKIIAVILLMASSLYGATRTETDNMMYKGLLTVSNNVVVASNLTVAGSITAPIVNSSNYTIISNFVLTATTSTNYVIPIVKNNATITDAKVYVVDTNANPYSGWLRFTFSSDPAKPLRSRLAQFDFLQAQVTNTVAYAIGATNLAVPDNTSFSINDMIRITGSTNEMATILGFTGTTNIIIDAALTNSHAVGFGVMRVMEIGMFPARCDAGCSNIYLNISRTNSVATTINLEGVFNYK
jgi:hypothetical protein